jgi:signal transduction histidine kinase
MATNLHLQAVRDDYEKLQRQHAALLESEARYRGLSKNLEQRVMEQVQTIDSTRRQLYQAEKMASVGQLAAGVAHEINNPIGFIVSNLGAARSYISQISAFMDTYRRGPGTVALDAAWKSNDLDYVLDDFQTLIKESSAGAARVAKIVKDLKDFSNVDRSDEEFIDINDCLRSVCNIAQSELSRTAEVGLKLSCLPLTRCYPAHLSQAFLNILLNAGQAVNSDGRVMISTTYLPADEHGADADESNGEICICISDNGGGIHQSIIDRVFDPFFTSREVGQGTGLGLTVCRDIVHAHDGRINIDSRVGEGSVVTIYLPVKAK